MDSTNNLLESSEQVSHSAIEILNDDCLKYIFNLLPVSQRIRIERVSKKWQELGKESWSKFKELDFDPKTLGLKPLAETLDYPEINENVIEKVLKEIHQSQPAQPSPSISFSSSLSSLDTVSLGNANDDFFTQPGSPHNSEASPSPDSPASVGSMLQGHDSEDR